MGSQELTRSPRGNVPTPELDDQQRRAGYLAALELRKARAETKRWMAEQENPASAFRYVFCQVDIAAGMKVRQLLMALPKVGQKKAASILKLAGIKENSVVKTCGIRQQEKLFAQVERLYR